MARRGDPKRIVIDTMSITVQVCLEVVCFGFPGCWDASGRNLEAYLDPFNLICIVSTSAPLFYWTVALIVVRALLTSWSRR